MKGSAAFGDLGDPRSAKRPLHRSQQTPDDSPRHHPGAAGNDASEEHRKSLVITGPLGSGRQHGNSRKIPWSATSQEASQKDQCPPAGYPCVIVFPVATAFRRTLRGKRCPDAGDGKNGSRLRTSQRHGARGHRLHIEATGRPAESSSAEFAHERQETDYPSRAAMQHFLPSKRPL